MSEPARLRGWRLVKAKHADNAFDGEGARLFGGRWNSAGKRVVYTSESLALAALETLVHLDAALPLPRFVAIAVDIQAADVETFTFPAAATGAEWPELFYTRRIGDLWLEQRRSVALAVPSFVIPQETNYLLNPAHPRFAKLVIAAPAAFGIDPRLRAASIASAKN